MHRGGAMGAAVGGGDVDAAASARPTCMAVTSVTEARPQPRLRSRRVWRFLGLAILLAIVAAALAIGAALAFDRSYQRRVLPGVSVAGVDVSGLGEAQLRARIAAIRVLPASLELVSGDRRVTVPADALGASVDVDAAVAAALAVGRSSGPLADVPERIAVWRDGTTVPLTASVDRIALRAWLSERAEQLRVAPRSAVIVRIASGWTATTPRAGKSLDVTAAAGLVEAALLNGGTSSVTVDLPIRTTQPDVDELDAVLAIAAADRMTEPLVLTFRSKPKWTLSSDLLRSAITFVGGGQRPTPVVDGRIIAAAVAPFGKDVARKAKESIFLKTKSGAIFGFVPGKGGRSLDVSATMRRVSGTIAGRQAGTVDATTSVDVQTRAVPPKLTGEEAAKIAPEMTLVGGWTTRFFPSEKNFFGANIRLPAAFINGTVIQPGSVFDFWGVVGPVTFSRGFGMGGFIEAGRTNPTGAVGGGICSASTTMFNAAARAGYQILERDNHAYYINRYPLGLDATVSKFGGKISQNMRFRNDTPNALFVRGLSGYNWVRFEIYSKPTGRTVTFSRPLVSNVRPAIDTIVKTAQLKKGQTERTETPTDGKDVIVSRTVRDSSGHVLHFDTWRSHYVRVDGVLRVGIG
jgi:vancomycin resistance protein YoaR